MHNLKTFNIKIPCTTVMTRIEVTPQKSTDQQLWIPGESPVGYSGSGILEERGSEIRDCNYERDTGFSGFTMPDSGNVVVKNRYPVMKSEKSFHFDNTLVAHIFLDPVVYFILTVPLFLSHHLPPLVHRR